MNTCKEDTLLESVKKNWVRRLPGLAWTFFRTPCIGEMIPPRQHDNKYKQLYHVASL